MDALSALGLFQQIESLNSSLPFLTGSTHERARADRDKLIETLRTQSSSNWHRSTRLTIFDTKRRFNNECIQFKNPDGSNLEVRDLATTSHVIVMPSGDQWTFQDIDQCKGVFILF